MSPASRNSLPSLISTSDFEVMVAPLSTLLSPSVAITPLLKVCSLPPEIVTPSRSTWAPEPDAMTRPALPLLTVISSSSTLAFAPAAAIVFALTTLLSMTSPALVAPCSVPELITL